MPRTYVYTYTYTQNYHTPHHPHTTPPYNEGKRYVAWRTAPRNPLMSKQCVHTMRIDNSRTRAHELCEIACARAPVMASITCYNQSAVRFVIPSRCDATRCKRIYHIRARYHGKSRLIRAIRAPLEITPTGNYISWRSFAKKGMQRISTRTSFSSRFSHQSGSSFPRLVGRYRTLELFLAPMSRRRSRRNGKTDFLSLHYDANRVLSCFSSTYVHDWTGEYRAVPALIG